MFTLNPFAFVRRSAFFFFCNEERGAVKAANPEFGVGDIAKALGKKWEACKDRAKYEAMAAKDKKRYEAVSTSTCFFFGRARL